jgi:hypothetical protein
MQWSDLLHTSKIFLMKVKLEKNHPAGKEGETIEVTDARANYFNRTGVIKLTNSKAEKIEDAIHEAAIDTDLVKDAVEKVKEEKPAAKVTKEDKGAKDMTTKSVIKKK